MNRILVVDDEPSILQGLSLAPATDETMVDLASAGKEVITKGSREQYGVLIVDLCLPDMHGFEVIRRMRELNPKIIPIVITAQCPKETVAMAGDLGVQSYFEKPFQIHAIRDAIAEGMARQALASL